MTFTSFPVGTCLASLTLAKLPLPMVLSSLYLPICGSSDERLRDDPRVLVTVEAPLPPPTPPPPPPTPPPPPPPVELLFVAASLPCKKQSRNKLKTQLIYCNLTDNELNKKTKTRLIGYVNTTMHKGNFKNNNKKSVVVTRTHMYNT